MKTLVVSRKMIVSILTVMLLIYGAQNLSYGASPTVTPGETNTTLKVSFPDFLYSYDENAYQVQLRRKSPQGEWMTKCVTIKIGGGTSLFGTIGVISGAGNYLIWASFTDLEPGTTYEARYRDTNLSECHENPPNPAPWSTIVEGTTHLVTPPRAEFVDANLARAVRRALRLDTRGEHIELLKIPEAELAKLTKLEYDNDLETREQWKISDLTGLEHATQLTELRLVRNNITDITPLAQLTQLTTLDLTVNDITDITPLAQLTQLTTLDLAVNDITDITPLAQLTQLTTLGLTRNNISDITPLAQLTKLTELNLWRNNISDIPPLAQLTQLTTLDLSDNQIVDITPLAQQLAGSSVTELDLSDNQIVDVTPLAQQLAGSSVTELDLSDNQIVDVTSLAQLAGSSVTNLDLSDNQIRDVAPLAALIQLKRLYLFSNPIENTYPLRALLDANPDLRIDITISKEERPSISVSTLQPLTGVTLDGAIVKLTLSSGTFRNFRPTIINALSITGIPGIGIASEISRSKTSQIEIKLTFDGNKFDGNSITTDPVLTLTVGTAAITNYNGPAYTLQIPVTAVSEAELAELSKALVASTDYPLTAAMLNGARVKLTLTRGVFDRSLLGAVKVSGIAGVTIHSNSWRRLIIERVSNTEITFELRACLKSHLIRFRIK